MYFDPTIGWRATANCDTIQPLSARLPLQPTRPAVPQRVSSSIPECSVKVIVAEPGLVLLVDPVQAQII